MQTSVCFKIMNYYHKKVVITYCVAGLPVFSCVAYPKPIHWPFMINAYFFKLHCQSYTESKKHTHPHFDFQGSSLQLFRDSPRHTHTDTHPGLSSVKTMAAPVLSTAPSLCLCSASPHCCPASVSVSMCMCVCVLQQMWGAGDCVEGLVSFNNVCVCVCVWDSQRGFPLHWVSTSLCLWPISVCHSTFTRTDPNRLVASFFSLHSFRACLAFIMSFTYYLRLIGQLFSEAASMRKWE